MWADPIGRDEVFDALAKAHRGPVAEGSIGAGTGTQAFGWKGGIGTSSRRLPEKLGGHTVGVLVQTNFGGMLTVNGAPVGRELGQFSYRDALTAEHADGSIMIVLATDAPLLSRNLERLAARAIMGLARTGSYASNGSGDYVIAFSTNSSVRRDRNRRTPLPAATLANDALSPLFAAAVEATEEAIYNALFQATTVRSSRGVREALPLDRVMAILEKYNALRWDQTLPPQRGSSP
jgi:D-aminopeptidase